MIKLKQPIAKFKNIIARKPSLPIKRPSSSHSNISNQSSCLSDRVPDKKSFHQDLSSGPFDVPFAKQYSSTQLQQQNAGFCNSSEKSLKRFKNRLSMIQDGSKRNEDMLTGFQWLLIMRYCLHKQNKRRPTAHVKLRTLVIFIQNKMYPDSLHTKVLVLQNQVKLRCHDVITMLEKDRKINFTLDDMLGCLSKYFGVNGTTHEECQSTVQTARFTENMKPNLQQKLGIKTQANSHSYSLQPKFIYKKEKSKQQNVIQPKLLKSVTPININDFNTQTKSGFTISPISISGSEKSLLHISNQTNNISFSMSESQVLTCSPKQPPIESQMQSSSQFPEVIEDKISRFQVAFNGICTLKNNLKNSTKAKNQKAPLIGFLEQILAYSIYKARGSSEQNDKRCKQTQSQNQRTEYFYGLKLESRKNISKISPEIMQRLFSSEEFMQYFQNLQAIKINEFYDELNQTIKVIGTDLRILNLSNNNIRRINFIKQMNLSQLQFINLNSNKLTNISELLTLQNLEQIHVKYNHIDHVSSDKVHIKRLQLIDLGYNQIQKQQDLWSLSKLPNLKMLNLAGNEILNNFKAIGLLPKQVIVDRSQMYVFSAFSHYKDIAFESRRKDAK